MLDEIKKTGWPPKRKEGIGSEADWQRAGEIFGDRRRSIAGPTRCRPATIYVTCHGEEMTVTYTTAHTVKVMRHSTHVPPGGMAVPSTAPYAPVCPLLFDAYLGIVTELPSEELRRAVADGFRAHTRVSKDEI